MCWNCGKSGHREKDCKQKWTQNEEWLGKKGKSKGKNKGKGKLNSVENWPDGAQADEHADGWTWNDEQAEEWWKAAGDQNGSSFFYSGRIPMIRLLGNQKDQLVELR